jgi:nucleotide-binding universal stress UspA family protein
MYKKIIVGYDGSDQSRDALALGKQLADATGAELVLSGVFVFHPMVRGGLDPVLVHEEKEEIARKVDAAAGEAGLKTQNVSDTSVARGLHALAEHLGADLVVVGSSSEGDHGHTLLGSTAASLMHGSPCAVAVAPVGYRDVTPRAVSTIVIGYDSSPEAKSALAGASELARATGAQLRLVCAAEPPAVVFGKSGTSGGWEALKDAVEEQARAQLETARAEIPADIKADAKVVSAEPVPALAQEADAPGSILALGSRGYGPVRGVMLGSVSRALAAKAPAPLVVFPRGSHVEDSADTTAEAATPA